MFSVQKKKNAQNAEKGWKQQAKRFGRRSEKRKGDSRVVVQAKQKKLLSQKEGLPRQKGFRHYAEPLEKKKQQEKKRQEKGMS